MKSCRKCGVELTSDNWNASFRRTKNYSCRNCKNNYLTEWRKRNPGAYKEWKYGISQEEYEVLIEKQGDSCAICQTMEPGGRHNTWHIDHDHVTGKVRGLLCWLCNSGLGKFKDDSYLLGKAVKYLENHKN